ncbi:MAG: histidinol dehydrogenase [Vicinamibacterales bacterium]
MKIIEASNTRAIDALFAKKESTDRAFERKVAAIVQKVRSGGDRALLRFAKQFDNLTQPIEVSREEMEAEAAKIPADVRLAIKNAARNIARVAARQIPKHFDVDVVAGVQVEQRVEPLESVGCYVPGGRFPLPSSLLMTAVPARVAGVRNVIAVCPKPEGAVMAAALEAGVTKLFRVGGAHAVAALAYGTESIPRVDKIVGPGNKWVAQAKAQVTADCAIDFYAGPTEIVVVGASGNPAWVAADLIAQAEHDPEARSIFITWKKGFAQRVSKAVDRIAKGRDIVTMSLAAHGAIVIAKGPDEAMALSNRFAPEHLVVESDALINRPIVAGAVFVGPHTAQAAGDYATGSNHVLPTAGAARFRGGLSAADFVRVMAVQRLTADGLARLAPTIVPLAKAEGLRAHAESIQIRLKDVR